MVVIRSLGFQLVPFKLHRFRKQRPPNAIDARGRTNIQRMEKGLAPLDSNGDSINLHHMLQRQDGPLAEVTQSFHTDNRRVIHINSNETPSGIDRDVFNKWRSDYWKQRAKDFKK
nr:HNH/ENDO VII family nuclease [Aeromonas veronii]